MAPEGTTLLMLMLRVNEETDTPEEAEEKVLQMLDEDTVQLTGNFRGTKLRDSDSTQEGKI